jgi:hypothetical protein
MVAAPGARRRLGCLLQLAGLLLVQFPAPPSSRPPCAGQVIAFFHLPPLSLCVAAEGGDSVRLVDEQTFELLDRLQLQQHELACSLIRRVPRRRPTHAAPAAAASPGGGGGGVGGANTLMVHCVELLPACSPSPCLYRLLASSAHLPACVTVASCCSLQHAASQRPGHVLRGGHRLCSTRRTRTHQGEAGREGAPCSAQCRGAGQASGCVHLECLPAASGHRGTAKGSLKAAPRE